MDEYSVREGNSVEVCIIIIMGTVGDEGITIDVEDIAGGTASGEILRAHSSLVDPEGGWGSTPPPLTHTNCQN